MSITTPASVLALALAATGPAASIPLRAGDYGAVGLACGNEPNAAIMSFDGRNFAYPHASQCTDSVTASAAGVLFISETCRALGNGSPTNPDTSTFRIRPRGTDRFDLIKPTGTMRFRRCGSPTFFDRH